METKREADSDDPLFPKAKKQLPAAKKPKKEEEKDNSMGKAGNCDKAALPTAIAE
jgi:hypothetical protein